MNTQNSVPTVPTIILPPAIEAGFVAALHFLFAQNKSVIYVTCEQPDDLLDPVRPLALYLSEDGTLYDGTDTAQETFREIFAQLLSENPNAAFVQSVQRHLQEAKVHDKATPSAVSVSLSEPPEVIGNAVLEAAGRGAVVIVLPSSPSSEESPLIVLEGDLSADLPQFQRMIAELPHRLNVSDG